jgi:hypothetical protein
MFYVGSIRKLKICSELLWDGFDVEKKAVCYVCGSGRQRNLIQVIIPSFVGKEGRKGYMCVRCLLFDELPIMGNKARYTGIEQKIAVNQFIRQNPKILKDFGVGSDNWLKYSKYS